MATGICPFCGKKVDKFIMFRGDVVGCRYCGIHVKQTNADRIRAMMDEELAELFWIRADCELCPNELCPNKEQHCSDDCKKHWLDWLKEEAKE